MTQIVELVKVTTPVCFFCGQRGTVTVPRAGVEAYQAGAPVQYAFPFEFADVREQIMTGTHPACWDEAFGDPEMDDTEVLVKPPWER